jgi:hypothetical protein
MEVLKCGGYFLSEIVLSPHEIDLYHLHFISEKTEAEKLPKGNST